MVITLTGTPGTGKTTVSEKMADEGYEVVHLTDYFDEKNIGEKKEGEREVRVGEMIESLESENFNENVIIEGHLAHHFESDICVVLRCNPDVLERRLSKRDYTNRKVDENVGAEKLDIVLAEAFQKQSTVVEVDTTDNSIEESVQEITRKIEKGESDYGGVDWSEFI